MKWNRNFPREKREKTQTPGISWGIVWEMGEVLKPNHQRFLVRGPEKGGGGGGKASRKNEGSELGQKCFPGSMVSQESRPEKIHSGGFQKKDQGKSCYQGHTGVVRYCRRVCELGLGRCTKTEGMRVRQPIWDLDQLRHRA